MNRATSIGGWVTIVVLCCWAPAGFTAAEMIDQSYEEHLSTDIVGLIGLGDSAMLHRAQTFTVGITGHLTRIQLPVSRADTSINEPLFVDIRTTSARVPTEADSGASILGSVTMPASAFPVYVVPGFPGPPLTPQAFIDVDFSSLGISLVAGQQLAIVLRTDQPQNQAYQWDEVQASSYGGGAAYLRSNGSGWTIDQAGTRDNRFRTFVEPVPEPGTIGLLVCGIVAAMSARTIGRRGRQRGRVSARHQMACDV